MNEGMGVPITQQLLDSARSQSVQDSYPHLFQNTTDTDYQEACFIRISKSCLFGDLDRYRLGDKKPSNHYGSGFSLAITPQCSTEMFQSIGVKRLHDQIESTVIKSKTALTKKRITDCRKNITTDLDFVLEHPKAEAEYLDYMEKVMQDAKDHIINKIKEKHGMNDQYEKQIVWAAETAKKGEKETRNKNALG